MQAIVQDRYGRPDVLGSGRSNDRSSETTRCWSACVRPRCIRMSGTPCSSSRSCCASWDPGCATEAPRSGNRHGRRVMAAVARREPVPAGRRGLRRAHGGSVAQRRCLRRVRGGAGRGAGDEACQPDVRTGRRRGDLRHHAPHLRGEWGSVRDSGSWSTVRPAGWEPSPCTRQGVRRAT